MDQKIPSPSTSPNSSSSSNNNGRGGGGGGSSPSTPNTNPNPNSNSNPYPTTFIQANTQSFKQVVQMLTGSSETAAAAAAAAASPRTPNPRNTIPPISKPTKKPAFKLYERRSSSKNLKSISPLIPHSHPGFRIPPEILSPSILNFPSLVLSPVTPLSPDPFNRSPMTTTMKGSNLGVSEEEKAIADKKFYLLPSPRNGGENLPKLLPLFPLTSPRMGMEKERGGD